MLHASLIRNGPLKPAETTTVRSAEADTTPSISAVSDALASGCFETLGVALLRGRLFTPQDSSVSPAVAIISMSAAKALFSDSDPIGKRIAIGSDAVKAVIVGIVQDARLWVGPDAHRPAVYRPLFQSVTTEPQLVVRVAGDPEALIPAITREVSGMGIETVRSAKTLQ